MAFQNELQIKFPEGYEFETMLTNLDSRYVMKGIWIFETEANSDTDTIDFRATWVNNDSPKTTTVTYKSTQSGVHLTGVTVTKVTKAPESIKRSKTTCPTCEPIPYSPVTYEPPGNKRCSQCDKQHHL